MALDIIDGPTISQNESLSDGVDCTGGDIVRITVPQEFTPANLTFQSSTDGNLYNDLYDAEGEEITMVAKPDTTIIVRADWTRSLGWIKIRSGTRAAPVEQKEDCKFAVAIDILDVP
jgi:deoxyadenosine/deoxycytidine kinase